jgi:hypothetical protein
MLKNWFNQRDAADVLRRLDQLSVTARPRWGTFSPSMLLCHLADPVRVALGEKTALPVRSPIGRPGIAQLVVWVLPWPKSAPTAPEFLPGTGMTPPGSFEIDKRTLVDLLERFSAVPPGGVLADSPVFGHLSRRAWGRLMWRHLDHHLRQFGL